MIIGSQVKLNLVPSGVMPVVYINQGDAGYDKEFLIYNGDSPYNVPSGVSATIRGTKSDGYGVTEAATVTTGSNLVTVTITEQMVAAAGENVYELVFVDTNDLRVASINMVWAVKKDALGDSVISDSDLDYATTVMNQLQSVEAFKAQLDNNTNGLSAETTARVAADNAEKSARIAADTALQSALNTETATRASRDTVLQAEIDQLVAPTGSAPSAAEIQNARIGVDGTTYTTLGDAIRGQVTNLDNELEEIKTIPHTPVYTDEKPHNLIKKHELISGHYINATGGVGDASGWNCSDYIDLTGFTHICLSGNPGNCAFYNSSKTFLETVSANKTNYAIPENAVYIRISVTDANKDTVMLNGGATVLSYDDGYFVVPFEKKTYIPGWQVFTVPVNQTIVKFNSTTANRDDSQSYANVECVIKLPATYTAYGVPTKLIMLCHGAGRGVTVPNPSDNKSWIDLTEYNTMTNYFVSNGYAVFDCNGYDNTWLGVNFWGAPKGIEAWRKAYDYIVDNYNVEREFTLFGFSMGGLTACSLMMNGFPNIKCAILASPVLDLEKCWEDGQTAYMEAGYGMSGSYNPAIVGGSDPMTHLLTVGNTEYCLPKMPPIKIWFGSTENGIAVNKAYAQRLVNAIQASGGFAVYREVANAGHEICYGGNNNCNLEYYFWANRFNDNYYN